MGARPSSNQRTSHDHKARPIRGFATGSRGPEFRSYRILEVEQERAGTTAGPIATDLTRLDDPALDWPGLARGLGVPGEAVDDQPSLARGLAKALATDGPYLIEARI